MKGIIMNTKKIYITPGINVINILTTYIMAGSTPGGGHSGLGGDKLEEVTIPGGAGGTTPPPLGDGGPVVQAKNNSFNAWETWEEY